jgi:hypothetical protein
MQTNLMEFHIMMLMLPESSCSIIHSRISIIVLWPVPSLTHVPIRCVEFNNRKIGGCVAPSPHDASSVPSHNIMQ